MSTQPSSLEAAVADEVGERTHLRLGMLPDAVQLDMLRGPDGKAVDAGAIRQVRGRGRPEGARNKRSKKIAQYIVQKFGDPIDALGNLATMPLADLLAIMREAQGGEAKYKPVRAIDAMALQVGVLKDLLTYVHGRQPLSVEVATKTDAFIIIPGINAPANVPAEQMEDALTRRGMDAIDFEQMRMIDAPQDAEFEPVPEDDGDGE